MSENSTPEGDAVGACTTVPDVQVTKVVILTWAEIHERALVRVLEICGGDVSKAATALDLGRATIYRKIKKYKIRLPSKAKKKPGT